VSRDRAVEVDELRCRLADRLSSYKVPRRFLLLPDDAIPVLSSGKLDRQALEALFDAR
jgi:acyl-CoA synthetase (AMP-forming)/AMP-acid ligase II